MAMPWKPWVARLRETLHHTAQRLPLRQPKRVLQTVALLRRRVALHALPWATGTAVLMGLVWIVLEHALRGEASQITLDMRVVAVLGIAGAAIGLATRARITLAGEFATNLQMSLMVLLVTFLLPATMLVIYALVTVASAGIVSLSWTLWLVVYLVALGLQLAVYLGLVAALFTGAQGGLWGVLVAGVIYIALVSYLANLVAGSPLAAWDGSFPSWAVARKELIPGWMFVIAALRRQLAPLDHNALMSVLASVGLGAAAALAASLLVRSVRRQLMRNTQIRPFLPMAGAPLSDTVPLLEQRMLLPLLTYSLVAWGGFLALRVL